MNKKEKSKLHRFINDNEFRTTFIGGGAEREVPVVDAQKLRRLIRRMNDQFELHKVKVPAFVAEWIDRAKEEDRSLYQVMDDIYGICFYHNESEIVTKWLFGYDESPENQKTFARAYLDGYEVEEQLYIMPLPYVELSVHYCIDKDGKVVFRQGNAQKFTEAELDEYFPDIKHFAVKV